MKNDLVSAAFIMGYLEKNAFWGIFGSDTKPENFHGIPKRLSGASAEKRIEYMKTLPKFRYGMSKHKPELKHIHSRMKKFFSAPIEWAGEKFLGPQIEKARKSFSREIESAGRKAFPYALGMTAGIPIIQTLLNQLFGSGRGPSVNMPPRMISPPYGMMQQGYQSVASRYKAPSGYYG